MENYFKSFKDLYNKLDNGYNYIYDKFNQYVGDRYIIEFTKKNPKLVNKNTKEEFKTLKSINTHFYIEGLTLQK